MKENNAANNESGKLMKNIMVPYQTMSIDEIKEDAWGWCAKLVDGAMAQGQGPQSYVPLMLSAARLGLGVRSSLSAEEKDLVILVFGQLLNMTHEELFAIFCNNKETDYSRMLEGVSRLGNTIAIPFLHLTLCFAYADGKIEKELPKTVEQAFGLNLVADFFQSGQESVPDPPAVLNDLERQIVSWFLEDNTLHSLTDIQRKFASESSETVKQTLDALCEKDILFGGENIAGNLYGLVDDDITIQAPAEPELEISDEDHEKLVQISNMLDALENMMETMGTESDPTPEAVKETELEFRFPESNRLTTERYSLIIPEGFTVNRNVDGRAFWAWLPDELNPKDSDNAPILLMEGMFIPDPRGSSTSVQERVEGGIAALSMVSRLTGMDIDEPEEFHSGDIHGFIGATENIHYIGTVLLPEGNQQIRVQANSEQYQGEAARNLLLEVLKTVQITRKKNSTSGVERRTTGNTSPSSERKKTDPKLSDPQFQKQSEKDCKNNSNETAQIPAQKTICATEQKAWEDEVARIKEIRKNSLSKRLSDIDDIRKKGLANAESEKNQALFRCNQQLKKTRDAVAEMETSLSSAGLFSFGRKSELKKGLEYSKKKIEDLESEKLLIIKSYEEKVEALHRKATVDSQNAGLEIDKEYPLPDSPAEKERKKREAEEILKERRKVEKVLNKWSDKAKNYLAVLQFIRVHPGIYHAHLWNYIPYINSDCGSWDIMEALQEERLLRDRSVRTSNSFGYSYSIDLPFITEDGRRFVEIYEKFWDKLDKEFPDPVDLNDSQIACLIGDIVTRDNGATMEQLLEDPILRMIGSKRLTVILRDQIKRKLMACKGGVYYE